MKRFSHKPRLPESLRPTPTLSPMGKSTRSVHFAPDVSLGEDIDSLQADLRTHAEHQQKVFSYLVKVHALRQQEEGGDNDLEDEEVTTNEIAGLVLDVLDVLGGMVNAAKERVITATKRSQGPKPLSGQMSPHQMDHSEGLPEEESCMLDEIKQQPAAAQDQTQLTQSQSRQVQSTQAQAQGQSTEVSVQKKRVEDDGIPMLFKLPKWKAMMEQDTPPGSPFSRSLFIDAPEGVPVLKLSTGPVEVVQQTPAVESVVPEVGTPKKAGSPPTNADPNYERRTSDSSIACPEEVEARRRAAILAITAQIDKTMRPYHEKQMQRKNEMKKALGIKVQLQNEHERRHSDPERTTTIMNTLPEREEQPNNISEEDFPAYLERETGKPSGRSLSLSPSGSSLGLSLGTERSWTVASSMETLITEPSDSVRKSSSDISLATESPHGTRSNSLQSQAGLILENSTGKASTHPRTPRKIPSEAPLVAPAYKPKGRLAELAACRAAGQKHHGLRIEDLKVSNQDNSNSSELTTEAIDPSSNSNCDADSEMSDTSSEPPAQINRGEVTFTTPQYESRYLSTRIPKKEAIDEDGGSVYSCPSGSGSAVKGDGVGVFEMDGVELNEELPVEPISALKSRFTATGLSKVCVPKSAMGKYLIGPDATREECRRLSPPGCSANKTSSPKELRLLGLTMEDLFIDPLTGEWKEPDQSTGGVAELSRKYVALGRAMWEKGELKCKQNSSNKSWFDSPSGSPTNENTDLSDSAKRMPPPPKPRHQKLSPVHSLSKSFFGRSSTPTRKPLLSGFKSPKMLSANTILGSGLDEGVNTSRGRRDSSASAISGFRRIFAGNFGSLGSRSKDKDRHSNSSSSSDNRPQTSTSFATMGSVGSIGPGRSSSRASEESAATQKPPPSRPLPSPPPSLTRSISAIPTSFDIARTSTNTQPRAALTRASSDSVAEVPSISLPPFGIAGYSSNPSRVPVPVPSAPISLKRPSNGAGSRPLSRSTGFTRTYGVSNLKRPMQTHYESPPPRMGALTSSDHGAGPSTTVIGTTSLSQTRFGLPRPSSRARENRLPISSNHTSRSNSPTHAATGEWNPREFPVGTGLPTPTSRFGPGLKRVGASSGRSSGTGTPLSESPTLPAQWSAKPESGQATPVRAFTPSEGRENDEDEIEREVGENWRVYRREGWAA